MKIYKITHADDIGNHSDFALTESDAINFAINKAQKRLITILEYYSQYLPNNFNAQNHLNEMIKTAHDIFDKIDKMQFIMNDNIFNTFHIYIVEIELESCNINPTDDLQLVLNKINKIQTFK